MRKKIAKRAIGVAMTSAMVVSSFGNIPGFEWKMSDTVKAADGLTLYVDSADYYDSKYDEENAYNGTDLGCTYSTEKTIFKVWSPEADKMYLNLYQTGSDAEEGAGVIEKKIPMVKGDAGVWSYEYKGDLKNKYYTYQAIVGGVNNGEAVDPYAKAVGVNGERGMVVDLDSTDPEGWDQEYNTKREKTNLSDIVVWEVHIRDFSIDVSSGVTDSNRGKYKAFTETGTTINGEGKISSCVDYLKKMGVTHVQILPMFDYSGVDETKVTNELSEENYNWGYNPMNYNAPEGSYSSNPYDGNVRIKETKEMIQALHKAGIKVIMDVVYNHTGTTEDSCFNKIMPDYYYKLKETSTGKVMYDDQSGCGNATRSSAKMFDKYMRESLMYWAEEYHIDGFRFDLMGIHDAQTMNNIRKDMDDKFGENTIVMYGEGWTGGGFDETSAYKTYARNLDENIGYFNDQIRDAIKGETAADKSAQIGFVQQNYGVEGTYTDHEKFPTSVFGGIMGSVGKNTSEWWMWRAYWADTSARVLSYDSCHDNMTIWDKFVQSTSGADVDYDTTNSMYTDMSRLAAGYLLSSHGGVFLHAGEEFARTKNGNENSYQSGDLVNKLDWSRIEKYNKITSYYQGMISIRKAFSGFRNVYTEKENVVDENTATGFFNDVNGCNLTEIKEFTEVVPSENSENIQSTVNSIGYYLSNDVQGEWNQVAVLINNTTNTKEVDLTAADGSTQWVLVSNGKKASVEGVSTTEANKVKVPGKSIVIAVPKNTFDTTSFKASEEVVSYGEEEDVDAPVQTPADSDKKTEETPAPDGDATSTPNNSEIPSVGTTETPTTEVPSSGNTALPSGATETPKVTGTPSNTSTGGAVTAKAVSGISISSFTITPNKITKGKTVTVSASAVGGDENYEYRFYIYNAKDMLISSSDYSKDTVYKWKAGSAGTYLCEVAVRDGSGALVTEQKYFTVEKSTSTSKSKKLSISKVKVNKLSVKKGKKIKVTVKASGGKKKYKYKFVVKNAKGKAVKTTKFTAKSSWTWKTTGKGNYRITVTVKDALKAKVSKTTKKIKVK